MRVGRRGDLPDHDVGRRARDRRQVMVLGHPIAREAEPVGEAGEVDRIAQRYRAGGAGGDRRKIEDRERNHVRARSERRTDGACANPSSSRSGGRCGTAARWRRRSGRSPVSPAIRRRRRFPSRRGRSSRPAGRRARPRPAPASCRKRAEPCWTVRAIRRPADAQRSNDTPHPAIFGPFGRADNPPAAWRSNAAEERVFIASGAIARVRDVAAGGPASEPSLGRDQLRHRIRQSGVDRCRGLRPPADVPGAEQELLHLEAVDHRGEIAAMA